jgi:ankyrin repeat protein
MTTEKSGVTPLPASANLEHLKKQAKQLLHAFLAHDAGAMRIVASFHPKPENFNGLRDAQLVIARRYGQQDWQQLTHAVELQKLRAATLQEQADQFIALACLRYNGDDRAWRYAQANALLSAEPALAQVNLYCALVAGDLAATKLHLGGNPALATHNGGPLNWPPLMYLTYSRVRAAEHQVLGIAQLLLSHGADADSHVMFDGLYRFSALAGAMGEGERGPVDCPPHQHAAALVDALLEAGASPNEFQGLYNTMFTDSLDSWLPRLIAHGLNASHTTDPGNRQSETTFDFILSQAAQEGRSKRLWILLGAGANPNAVSRYNGRSAHTNAVLAGQKDCAAALLQYGARVEKLNSADEFRVACWNHELERADQLLRENPQLIRDPQVFSDVARTRVLLVPWLLERGFDINSQTRDGRTVLHRFAAGNELEDVKTMIALGANPNLTEHHYRATPMGFALHNRCWDVVHYLADLSEDIFDVCRIVHAVRVAALLEKNPALARLTTPMGNTPLHLINQAFDGDIDTAASTEVIQLLLRHGADPQAQNKEAMTPPQWHRKMGNDETADLLLQVCAGY